MTTTPPHWSRQQQWEASDSEPEIPFEFWGGKCRGRLRWIHRELAFCRHFSEGFISSSSWDRHTSSYSSYLILVQPVLVLKKYVKEEGVEL